MGEVLTVFLAVSPTQELVKVLLSAEAAWSFTSLVLYLPDPVAKTSLFKICLFQIKALGSCASYNFTKPCVGVFL